MSRTITLCSSAMPSLLGEPALILTKLDGEESFSSLYTYTITAKTPANPAIPWQAASNIDIKALIGKEMTVELELDGNGLDVVVGVGQGKREISGLVEKARFLGRDANQAMFEIVIRPWLYLANLTSDFKIFQHKTVVEIINEVLEEYSFPIEKRLTGSYPALDFQVQYGETDFNFIERLMEEWGIYWFYEHHDHKHKLVLVDHVGAHKRSASEAYHVIHYLPDDPKADREYIHNFQSQETITTGKWFTNDYDFTKSRADISAIDSKPRKTSFNEMELYHWPGDYEQPTIGEQLARIRMEEKGAIGSRATGSGELRGIACGISFELKDFPLEKANREYLVITSHLVVTEIGQVPGEGQFSYHCEFTVQPTSKIYRHPQLVVRPKTSGPQTAVIVGPPGEDIWTDKYGRVKVRFLWDRYGKNRETDSCWIRVSQAWAGNNFGGIYIPRVGHEVIVDFINGDPDRPLIMGSLYNNVTMPPWDLPANATQSGLISRTVGGGRTNFNGIQFEDKPGLEQYWEQAERDMSRLTKRNESQVIGQNSDIRVGASRNVFVGANAKENVIGNSALVVGAGLGIQVGGNQSDNVLGAKGINVGGVFATNVGGAYTLAVGGAMAENVGGAYNLAVGGPHTNAIGGPHTMTVGGPFVMTAGGELCITAPKIKLVANHIVLQGGQVDLNPGDSCSGGGGGGGGGGGAAIIPGLPGLSSLGFIGLSIPLPPIPTPPPEPTTPEPTTPEPTTPEPTTPEPTTPEPTTPEPTTPEPTTPEPTTPEPTTPEPTTPEPTTPEPTTPEPTTPEPTTPEPTTPEPTTPEPTTPEPTTPEPTTPEPTTPEPTTPEPTTPEPTTPEPTTPEPTTPEPTTPEPTTPEPTTPEPTTPEPTTPEPTTPEPTTPEPTTPEPTTPEPTTPEPPLPTNSDGPVPTPDPEDKRSDKGRWNRK